MAGNLSPIRKQRQSGCVHRGASQGVTLIEACIAMSVLAILTAIAIPSLHALQKRQQVSAAMHLITTQLSTARMTAVSHNTPVVVCPSNGGARCRGDSNWNHEWLVFRDPDGNKQPDKPEDLYRSDPAPLHPKLNILSSSGRRYMRYQATGLSYGSNLTLRVCFDGELVGSVVVNNAGRIRSKRETVPKSC